MERDRSRDGDSSGRTSPYVRAILYDKAWRRLAGTRTRVICVARAGASHGGRIEVQTELQRGSTFTVVCPLEQPDMSGERAAGVDTDKEQKDDDYATTHSHC